jgi:UDP-GlcNAc:undecaprenyl-phosphate GlcNAc-1-phosphate transferase
MTGSLPPSASLWLSLAGWYVAAAVASALAVPFCRSIALKAGYVAQPRQDRWHRRTTALFGGAGIAVPTLLLALAAGDLAQTGLLLAGGAVMFAVGLTDDILSLKPSSKLIAEIALASIFLLHGQLLNWTSFTAVDMLLTVLWLVGVTNAFNLLDNMDGLCGGVAIVAGVALMSGLAARPGAEAEMRYLALVIGAATGFLIYNIHPASIFMGDAGSLFLGFSLAAVTLTAGGAEHDRSRILSIVVAPMLVLLIPIFDTTLVTVSRLLSGRKVSQGGRDHSSHRLVAIGLSEASAVRVLWALAAAAGIMGTLVRRFADDRAWLLSAVFLLAMVLFAVYLAQVRVYEERSAVPSSGVTPVLVKFMYKRRVAEVLLDVCLVSIAYYGSWRLRFEGPEWNAYFPKMLDSFPIALALQMIALFGFGAYRGAWRYFGLMDGVTFAKAVSAGTVALIVAILYLYRFEHYSRGVFVIYAALLMLLLSGSRASFRLIGEFAHRRRTGKRLAIFADGHTGSLVLRELVNDSREQYRIVGFFNDDPATYSTRLQGYSVLGGERKLLELIASGGVEVVVIGDDRLGEDRIAALQRACIDAGVWLLRFRFHFEPIVSPS